MIINLTKILHTLQGTVTWFHTVGKTFEKGHLFFHKWKNKKVRGIEILVWQEL